MSYETIQSLGFRQERLDTVYPLKGAILLKDGRDKVLQLKLHNGSREVIDKVVIEITSISEKGEELGVQSFTYNDLLVDSGMDFGSNIPIPLMFDAATVKVTVKKVDNDIYIKNNRVVMSKSFGASSYNAVVCVVFLVYTLTVLLSFLGTASTIIPYTLCSYLMVQMIYSDSKKFKVMKLINIVYFFAFILALNIVNVQVMMEHRISNSFYYYSNNNYFDSIILLAKILPLIMWTIWLFVSFRNEKRARTYATVALCIIYLVGVIFEIHWISLCAVLAVCIWSWRRIIKRRFELLPRVKEEK